MNQCVRYLLLLLPLILFGCVGGSYDPYQYKDEVSFKVTSPEIRDADNKVLAAASGHYETNQVIVVNPAYEKTLEAAKEINTLVNPTPSAPFIGWGITLALAGLSLFAKIKNKQYSEAIGTLVQSVEKFDNKNLKNDIEDKSALHGTDKTINSFVNKLT